MASQTPFPIVEYTWSPMKAEIAQDLSTLGIPLFSTALKSYSLKSSTRVKPGDFTFNLHNRLHTLYAQSFRTTLAPYVLPRLLAHS